MARKAREKSKTGVYAVILRGTENIFSEPEMREAFSKTAEKYLGKGLLGIRILEDKVHMLVKESDSGISLDMKPLVTSFARTYNRTHELCGRVFADRFKSVPIENRALKKECTDYLNGGDIATPYISGSEVQASVAVKKPSSRKTPDKKPAVQRVEKTPSKPAKEESEAKAKPVKKKNTLPSWLL